MATPVLPYPDMDFTPLDILTAEEMDEIVANVEYLKTFCGGLADGLSYAHDEIIEFGVKIGTDAERLHVAGMFTNGSRSVVFSIPTLKSLENISQISLMDSYVWVRHADGGYLLNGESLSQSGIVVSLDKASQNIISISAVKDSGWSFSNNSVVLVSGYFKFKLV